MSDKAVIAGTTLPWRGRVGPPQAVRGGVTARQRVLNRCHPLPARWRGPTSPLQGEVTSGTSDAQCADD